MADLIELTSESTITGTNPIATVTTNKNTKTRVCKGNVDLSKQLKEAAIDTVVKYFITEESKNNGRLPHNCMDKAIEDLKKNGIHVDRNHLNYRKKQASKKQAARIAAEREEIAQTVLCNTNNTIINIEDIKKLGRPVGNTILSKQKIKEQRIEAINDIAHKYTIELNRIKNDANGSGRTSSYFLDNLIVTKWEEYELTDVVPMVPAETIRNRYKKKVSPNCSHRGCKPPLVYIEDTIVEICVNMGKAYHPLTIEETINLANDMIEGTNSQERLSKMKLNQNKNVPIADSNKVGRGWWSGFFRRHADKLVTKRGVLFASNRCEWTKLPYITKMYNEIYDNFVEAKVAVKRPEPVACDIDGNVVSEDQIFGKACDIEITHPQFILFADEVGCNTNQKKDGNYGGRKYVVGRSTVPKEVASITDKHFTVLGFTAASGEPVCCVVIFTGARNEIPLCWTTGIDIQTKPVLDEVTGKINIEDDSNFGPGKYFPGGPTCEFRGKTVPMLSLMSPSGGINGALLVEILKYLDLHQIYERVEGGPIPVLVVDGHESRMDAGFSDYINDPKHRWYVNIGVPYATALWQVGDSSEQNGVFKQMLTDLKRRLTRFKSDHNMPIAIASEDIVVLVSAAWPTSFGRIRTNKKAIAERGWYPPNRNLLLHKDIVIETEAEERVSKNYIEINESLEDLPNEVNTSNGTVKVCLDTLIRFRARTGGVEQNQVNLAKGVDTLKDVDEARRMSAGIMVANGIHCLNHPTVVGRIRTKRDKDRKMVRDKKRKVRYELTSKIEGVKKLRTDKPNIDKWNNKDCALFIRYKRRDDDPPNPKHIAELRQRCVELQQRNHSPCCSDAEDDGDDYNNEVDEGDDGISVITTPVFELPVTDTSANNPMSSLASSLTSITMV